MILNNLFHPLRHILFCGKMLWLKIRGYGGIGRRARFRFWWETVQVQVLLSALKIWKRAPIPWLSVRQIRSAALRPPDGPQSIRKGRNHESYITKRNCSGMFF